MSEQSPSKIVDLAKLHAESNQAMFLMRLGEASQAYGQLEQALCHLLSVLLATPIDLAAIVYFSIVNTRSRNRILEALMKKRHGNSYKTFFDSLIASIRRMDGLRNNHAHWHTVNEIDLEKEVATVKLTPPNFWARTDGTPTISEQDLRKFTTEVMFYCHLTHSFCLFLTDPSKIEAIASHGIFQQPITYPPPDTHPLSPISSGLQTQPQSSEG